MLTQNRLIELLDYNASTGIFMWRRSGPGRWGSLLAGRVNPRRGYLQISIDYKKYYTHRLAWLYTFGVMPEEIDHINGDRLDNRIENLRPATRKQNSRNRVRPQNNKSGVKGVYRSSPNTWRAQIKVDGKQIVLGWFRDLGAARAAYLAAAKEHFGEFANDR